MTPPFPTEAELEEVEIENHDANSSNKNVTTIESGGD